jgi:Dyp-type peroxidase family
MRLAPSILVSFSAEFLAGPAEENRSRRLGDVASNAPAHWQWGNADRVPHIMAMFFAEPGRLDAFAQRAFDDAWREGFEVLTRLDTSDLGGVEHFGFTDGISQPEIDWTCEGKLSGASVAYGNMIAPGEFLLGYRNEYDKYTDRPLLDSDAASAGLPSAEDAPEKKDLARNGTYLVLRSLRQDVRAFHRYMGKAAAEQALEPDMLAAALVGRRKNGEPLLPIQEQPIVGIAPDPEQIRLNQFTYAGDPAGERCPVGAHVRRSNPRTADYGGQRGALARFIAALGFPRSSFQEDLLSSARFHRLLRRGREYGPPLSQQQALEPTPPDDPERGLHFICLNANISRQFEFVQSAWVTNAKFSGLSEEPDPLLGNGEVSAACPVTGAFSIPVKGGPARRLRGLPSFVTVRGGAYFFLPSMRALQYITS